MTTLATMWCQSSLSSGGLMSCVGLTWAHIILPWCIQIIQILQSLVPLALLPSLLPITVKFSRLRILMTWPRKASCRWRILFIIVRRIPHAASLNTSRLQRSVYRLIGSEWREDRRKSWQGCDWTWVPIRSNLSRCRKAIDSHVDIIACRQNWVSTSTRSSSSSSNSICRYINDRQWPVADPGIAGRGIMPLSILSLFSLSFSPLCPLSSFAFPSTSLGAPTSAP